MNENPINKNIRNAQKKIAEEPKIIYQKNFSIESEIIVNYIIEKIISFTISESLKNKVDKTMPGYCYDQIYQTLNIITQLDFISYEKDDYPFKGKNLLKKMKSAKNINTTMTLPLPSQEKELLNSEEIRKYKFEKEYDINISNDLDIKIASFENPEKNKDEKEKEKDINKEVIFDGILRREGYYDEDNNNSFQSEEMKKNNKLKKYNKKNNYNFREDKLTIIKEIYSSMNIPRIENENEKDPFNINPEEKIEAIQNVESHKLDIPSKNQNKNNKLDIKNFLSIPFETIVESTNYWKSLSQPIPAPIDRDAGTKIKFDRPLFSKFNKNMNLKNLEDNKTINQSKKQINNDININESRKTKLRKTTYFNTLNNTQEKGKKKKIYELPFEATDVDPDKLIAYKESEDILFLRDKNEREIQERKKEKELLLKIEKEKQSKLEELEEKRKELYRKNVTVDIKGDIVFIKPIDMRSLMEEFNKGKINFKNIKTVEAQPKYDKDKMNIKVEKNPDIIWNDIKDDKNKKNRKKKQNFQKSDISNNNNNINSPTDLKQKKVAFEKGAKFASGSNFNIFNPEVGVNITEDRRQKSGGKDFYKKFNRFSLEVFQEHLSKTSNSFFPKISEQNFTLNQTNESNTNSINSSKRKQPKFNNKSLQRIFEYKNKNITNNNILALNNHNEINISLKTKNLKIALQDLDLMTEREMHNLNKTKKLNKTIFLKKVLNTTSNNPKKDFNAMNKFTKTLVGKENWSVGTYTEKEKYNNYKIPKKPENIELKRELPSNMLKYMPRKRLPPINSMIKLEAMTGFYTNRNNKKIKEKNNEKKENIESK